MSRKKKGLPINGWVIIDKPADIGSTTVVSLIKRLANAQKAGHAGTLDPAATGVLPIALGEATKTIPYVMDGEKVYTFTVRWGQKTTTDDAEGKVTAESEKRPSLEEIQNILPDFIGEIDQIPPDFSAVHVNGQRAYDLARREIEIKLAPRRIRIDNLKVLRVKKPDEAEFEVVCGKGTYVRSLARDMAEKLDCLGHVRSLRRVRCGKFSVENAFSLEYLRTLGHISKESQTLLPVETVLDDIPALALTETEAVLLSNGGFLPVAPVLARTPELRPDAEKVFQAKADGRLVGLVRVEDGKVRPIRIIVQ